MEIARELMALREDLIREIDEKIGRILEQLPNEETGAGTGDSRPAPAAYESIYSLNAGTGIFKGKRPTGVIFADGTREDVPTWKKAAEVILKRCNQEKHQALMDLRGRLLGRNRVLLGSETGRMRSPVKIDQALYVGTHYGTETLLKILTTRILNAVGFDYSGIRIAVQND